MASRFLYSAIHQKQAYHAACAGEMRRASTLTSAGSGHSHKRPSGTDILEEACKRARSTPDLSHSSFNSDTSEDFSAASGAVYLGAYRLDISLVPSHWCTP